MSSAKFLTALLMATLLMVGCAEKDEGPVEGAKDALNIREHEKLKDAGENASDAVRDAKEGVKDAVEGK